MNWSKVLLQRLKLLLFPFFKRYVLRCYFLLQNIALINNILVLVSTAVKQRFCFAILLYWKILIRCFSKNWWKCNKRLENIILLRWLEKMSAPFVIINEKIVIAIILDCLKLFLKIRELLRRCYKLLILFLSHLNILRIFLKLRICIFLYLVTIWNFVMIYKDSFPLNFNLLKLRQLLIFIFNNLILFIQVASIKTILKRFTLHNCRNASLLNVRISIFLWLLNFLLQIFAIFLRRGLIEWVGEFFFDINQVFIALFCAVFYFILTESLHLKVEIIGLNIVLGLEIILNQYAFQARTILKLDLILILNYLLKQLQSLVLVLNFV